MTHKEAEDYLARVCAQLSEHFDAVQIVASRLLPDNCTACTKRGTGNFYARIAMCSEFVEEAQMGRYDEEDED